MSVAVLDHERLRVTWTPPPSSEQSGELSGYTVRVTEVESGRTWMENTNLVTLWTLTSLHPYYMYEVQVRAVPEGGSGLYSDAVSARTLPSGIKELCINISHVEKFCLNTFFLTHTKRIPRTKCYANNNPY